MMKKESKHCTHTHDHSPASTQSPKHTHKKTMHKVASIASFGCLIHCLLTPAVVVAAPFLGDIFSNHAVEWGLLGGSIALGIFTIGMGYCHHKRRHTVVLFGVGALLWILHSVMESHGAHGIGDLLVLGLGSIFVILSYYQNHKNMTCCDH